MQVSEVGSSRQALTTSKVVEIVEQVTVEQEEVESPVVREARMAGNAMSPSKVELHAEEEGPSMQDMIVSRDDEMVEHMSAEQEDSAKEVRVAGSEVVLL